MTRDIFLSLISLAIGTLFTPGPNNAMLAASGATFGIRRTLPHALGVATGFPTMLLIVGLALGQLFQTSALLREGLRWGGAALLLWMAWKIAISTTSDAKPASTRPMSFLGAAAFQWINPKAWSMAVAATSQFVSPDRPVQTAAITAATFLTLGLFSSTSWMALGRAISGWLTTEGRRRAFNFTMAGLIVLSIVQLVRH